MDLKVTVTLTVETRPGPVGLERAIGSPAFLDWNRGLADLIAGELGVTVVFDNAEVGWSAPIVFPIALGTDPSRP
jgi:hypothetical protein